MKIVLQSDLYGKVTWELPVDLAEIIDGPEEAIADALHELAFGRQFAEQIAGKAKSEILEIIQKQVDAFFLLLASAHRAARTTNPPSKLSKVLEQGLASTAVAMKKAATE